MNGFTQTRFDTETKGNLDIAFEDCLCLCVSVSVPVCLLVCLSVCLRLSLCLCEVDA